MRPTGDTHDGSRHDRDNWVASPLSIALAFAMARVGALGATAAALDKVFGYPTSGRDDAFNAIIRSTETVSVPPPASAKQRTADSQGEYHRR